MKSVSFAALCLVLSDLLEFVDYDIWKCYFTENEEGNQDEMLEELEEVFRRSLEKHHILD